MPKDFIRVGDLTMHYELADYTEPWRTEEPETFLLHSGYCRNMEFWRAWVPLLGLDYRVLRMDPRGWGLTSKPPRGSKVTAEMMAADAIGLMDALGIKKAHWVGDSTGGVVGLKAAHDYPDRLQSLTMFNSIAKMGQETTSVYALDQADQGTAIEKYGVYEWCMRTIKWRVDQDHAPKGIGEWIAREMEQTPAYIAATGYRDFSSVDLTPLIPHIKTPTLLLLGSKCTPRRHEKTAELHAALPNSKLVEVEGWEQGLHFLEPAAMVKEVRQFIGEMVRQ